MCLTPEKCLGGRAWPNIVPGDERHEIPLLLWCNSTLGLLMHWWKGTRQQMGRAIMTITAIPDLPVLDPRTLTQGQIDHCRAILGDFKDKPMLPANEAYRDETRKALDRALLFGITSVLQLNRAWRKGWICCGSSGALSHLSTAARALESMSDRILRAWCVSPRVTCLARVRADHMNQSAALVAPRRRAVLPVVTRFCAAFVRSVSA